MAKESDPSATIDKIVEVARNMVSVEGATKLSVRRVAREARVSLGTVSYYFPSRGALVEACLDEQAEFLYRMIAQYRERLADGEQLADIIEEIARLIFNMCLANRETVRLRQLELLSTPELPAEGRATFMYATLDHTATSIAQSLGVGVPEARFIVQSMANVIVRYALFAPGDLARVTGLSDAEQARRATEEHIAMLSRMLIERHLPHPDESASH